MTCYYEQASFDGSWSPCTQPDKPSISKGRLQLSGGLGPRVRGVTEVPEFFHHLTLDQLEAVLGPDGHLSGTQR